MSAQQIMTEEDLGSVDENQKQISPKIGNNPFRNQLNPLIRSYMQNIFGIHYVKPLFSKIEREALANAEHFFQHRARTSALPSVGITVLYDTIIRNGIHCSESMCIQIAHISLSVFIKTLRQYRRFVRSEGIENVRGEDEKFFQNL